MNLAVYFERIEAEASSRGLTLRHYRLDVVQLAHITTLCRAGVGIADAIDHMRRLWPEALEEVPAA